ncbi:MAG: hypothetical protein V1835_01090 [Candidatus Micrarchaeota archaeon]
MIIRPSNVPEMIRMIREVPEEKRRVLCLVQRHANERTYDIAYKEHEKWGKEGALVVKLPRKYTPEGIALAAFRKKMSHSGLEAHLKTIPSDNELAQILWKGGITSPVINFHGTASDSRLLLVQLGIESRFRGRISAAPVPINDNTNDNTIHPNEVLVEYYFLGKPQKRSRKVKSAIGRIWRSLDEHSFLDPAHYLRRRRATNEDIGFFITKYSNQMLGIIRCLAAPGRFRPGGGKGTDG